MLKGLLAGALLTAVLLAQRPAPPKAASPLNTTVLEAYIRHLLVWPASVDVTIGEPTPALLPGFYAVKIRGSLAGRIQEDTFYVSGDTQTIIRGELFNVNTGPFEAELKLLKTDNQPFLGAPDAPVTVIEFADFQCPYCRQEASVVRKQLMAEYPKDLKLVYMDYPLTSIHPFARGAAVLGRCIYAQNNDSFWAFHDWIFEHQGEITADNLRTMGLDYARGDKNLDVERLTACMVAPEPRAQVDRTIAIGDALSLNATPTFFINGRRMVGTVALENLKIVVENEIAWAKTQAAKSAADCCSVQLALPGTGKAAAQ